MTLPGAALRKQLILLLSTLLFLSACGGTATPTPSGETPGSGRPTPSAAELEVSDNAPPIEATAGEEFTITLRTNPPSGYHWEIAEEFDAGVVEYVWKDFVPTQPDRPNSSGKDVWRFKAVAPGEAKIVLGYYLGETEDSAEMLTFTVIVK